MSTIAKATHAGMCYLCASRIYKGDEIRTWSVGENQVAAHAACLEANMRTGTNGVLPKSREMTLAAVKARFDCGAWDEADFRFLWSRAAAAPEMLEALSNLVSYLREFWPDEPLFFSESRKAADVIVAAEAVIEKAQGL